MELLAGAALLAVLAGRAAGAVVHAIARSHLRGHGALAVSALCGLGAATGGLVWVALDHAVFGGPDAPWDEGITAAVIAAYGLGLSALFGAWAAAWPPPVRRPAGLALHRLLPRSFPTAPSPGPRGFGCAISFGVGASMMVLYLCGVLLGLRLALSASLLMPLAVGTVLALTRTIALVIRSIVRRAR